MVSVVGKEPSVALGMLGLLLLLLQLIVGVSLRNCHFACVHGS